MINKYYGVWPTMITAFDDQGNLDLNANRAITKNLIEKGCDGLFAVCQSSEMFMLSLEEKIELAKIVIEESNGTVPVIGSGHTSDAIEDQIIELRAMAETGVDAVVLVSNRLAKENEGTEVLMANLKRIMHEIPEVSFGVYECPYPYRRLLTDEELKWCADSGRVVFLKDVSCDHEIQKRRVKVIAGSELKLFNANTETLLDSLIVGYHGYNGVMGNFHIDLYKWLFDNYETSPEVARSLQLELTEQGNIENFGYPVNAKYHMTLEDVKMTLNARRMTMAEFTPAYRNLVDQLVIWEKNMKQTLNLK